MGHGEKWTEDQIIFVATLRLRTLYSWERIAEKVRAKFGTGTNARDVESKYNKKGGIRPVRDGPPGERTKGDILDDWRHYKTAPPEEQYVVDAARRILATLRKADRLWE